MAENFAGRSKFTRSSSSLTRRENFFEGKLKTLMYTEVQKKGPFLLFYSILFILFLAFYALGYNLERAFLASFTVLSHPSAVC